MLEYQSGILFLTTNRVDDFDTAFFSRIHVRLEFNKPGAPQRTLIWSYLAEKDGHDISQEDFVKLENLPKDGRRIKNVLRVASLLCRSRDAAGKTTLDDVKKSLRISAGDPNDEGVEQAIQDFCGRCACCMSWGLIHSREADAEERSMSILLIDAFSHGGCVSTCAKSWSVSGLDHQGNEDF